MWRTAQCGNSYKDRVKELVNVHSKDSGKIFAQKGRESQIHGKSMVSQERMTKPAITSQYPNLILANISTWSSCRIIRQQVDNKQCCTRILAKNDEKDGICFHVIFISFHLTISPIIHCLRHLIISSYLAFQMLIMSMTSDLNVQEWFKHHVSFLGWIISCDMHLDIGELILIDCDYYY